MNYPDQSLRTDWLDVAIVVTVLALTICTYSYLAKGAQ